MIVKFLANKKGGSTKSIDYLLNKERVANGTAKILSGNEKDTRDIINSITKKQKVTFGVLSFEEENIPEQQKKELMQDFEKTFLAGLEKENYNILWVEHTDKGRLELNCVIPKIELSTGRAMNPYFHGSDFHLAEMYQEKSNLKYGYSNPKDPAKQSSIQGNKKALGLFRGYRNLDKKLKELVSEGIIESRDDILELLKENNIEVTDIQSDKIEVKLEGNKKPRFLKGDIYTNEFTSIDEIRGIREEQTQREREFANRDNKVEYAKVAERLERAIDKRASFNKEKFGKPLQRTIKTERNKQEDIQRAEPIKEARKRDYPHKKKISKARKPKFNRQNFREVRIKTFKEKESEREKLRRESEHPNIKPFTPIFVVMFEFVMADMARKKLRESERERDRIREATRSRVEERENALTRARGRAIEPRTSLYEKSREDRTSIYEQARKPMQDRANRRARRERYRNAIDSVRRTASELREAVSRRYKEINSQSAHLIRLLQERTLEISRQSIGLIESVKELELTIKERTKEQDHQDGMSL